MLKRITFLMLLAIIVNGCSEDEPVQEIINTDLSVSSITNRIVYLNEIDLNTKLQSALTYNYGNALENEVEKTITINTEMTNAVITINIKSEFTNKYNDQNLSNNTTVVELMMSTETEYENEGSANDYTLGSGPWNQCDITYSFVNFTSDLSEQDQIEAFEQATQVWSDVISDLTFENIGFNNSSADIIVLFTSDYIHSPCPTPFAETTLAHAYYPYLNPIYSGDIHFNDNFYFTTSESFPIYDFTTIAIHELGHSLGLGHSDIDDAIMYPSYSSGTINRDLDQDDINGLLDLYQSQCSSNSSSTILLSGDLDFGDIEVNNNSNSQTLTISNIGNESFNVFGITSNDSAFSILNNQSATILPEDSIDIEIQFTPTQEQNYSAILTVENDAELGNSTIQVTGIGVDNQTSQSMISLSGELDFGDVEIGTIENASFQIHNSGDQSFDVTGINFPSDVYSPNWNAGTIAAGETQNVTVTFQPTNEQSYNGIVVVDNDASSGNNTISINGNGVTIYSEIALSGNLNFGDVEIGSTENLTFQIENLGNQSFEVTDIDFPDNVYSPDWESGTINVGETRNVTVTFQPTNEQSYNGIVVVNNDANIGNNTLSINGQGVSFYSEIELSGNLDFDNQEVGTNSSRTLTISNIGNSDFTVSSISTPNGFSANYSGIVTSDNFVEVTVTFSPTAQQNYNGTIIVNSDADVGINEINCFGNGIDNNPTGTLMVINNTNFQRYFHIKRQSDSEYPDEYLIVIPGGGTENYYNLETGVYNFEADNSEFFVPANIFYSSGQVNITSGNTSTVNINQ